MDRRLSILAVGMFAMGTDNFVVAGILPGVAASLHTSVALAGLMVTCYAFTYAIAAPIMAALAGRWPRKLLLVSALGIFVAGNVLSNRLPSQALWSESSQGVLDLTMAL
ncbi:MFS transporter, partial [Burkholderia multivorans]|uniref:MFS transporter n=1 Tax=Burkholderia multivorans TaxID=87883 RepID=UPI00215905D7